MNSSREPGSKTTSRSCPQPQNANYPSSLTVLEMNTFSMSLQRNHSNPTTSSPFGRRSTFGSFWARPSCSRVILMCGGRRRSVTPVLQRQSQPSSRMSPSSMVLSLLQLLKANLSRVFRPRAALMSACSRASQLLKANDWTVFTLASRTSLFIPEPQKRDVSRPSLSLAGIS